jgi:hypothetical protein
VQERAVFVDGGGVHLGSPEIDANDEWAHDSTVT